jgi:hypothetical protein
VRLSERFENFQKRPLRQIRQFYIFCISRNKGRSWIRCLRSFLSIFEYRFKESSHDTNAILDMKYSAEDQLYYVDSNGFLTQFDKEAKIWILNVQNSTCICIVKTTYIICGSIFAYQENFHA